ncbi:hypothetical protein PAXRUDRAFT_36596 [Paxillus rubicundulus Ve08.2h10]|uniref:Uncharacterized protein n=1 Tax=Paxillus rubicundulus Ve08.2h10 TaxID=930991 RepID=A0A0D0DD72_9AGAM|nr:hypothetical protein PAXRUDRAFT_36596 [Paxillus rubicundulus Ve08.2h10]
MPSSVQAAKVTVGISAQAPPDDDGVAHLAVTLSGISISGHMAKALGNALKLIFEDILQVAESGGLVTIAADSNDSDNDPEAAFFGSEVGVEDFEPPSDLDDLDLAPPVGPGRATLTGTPGLSMLFPPPSPLALQKCDPDLYYCITKGLHVGIFSNWGMQSKVSTLPKGLDIFKATLEARGVEILI